MSFTTVQNTETKSFQIEHIKNISSEELDKQNVSTKTKEEYSSLKQFNVFKDSILGFKPQVAHCIN